MRRFVSGVLGVLLLLSTATPPHLVSEVQAQDQGQTTVFATVRINPIVLTLESPSRNLKAGQNFEIGVHLTNAQPTSLTDVEFGINLDEGPCLRVNGTKTNHRGMVRAGDSVSHDWRVKVIRADPACSAIVVLATASATDNSSGELLVATSPARILIIH